MMARNQIALGDKCRDQVTGFEGIVTSRVEFLNGCVRYCLESPGKTEGVQELYFDQQRLVIVDADAIAGDAPVQATGGSRPAPPRTGAR